MLMILTLLAEVPGLAMSAFLVYYRSMQPVEKGTVNHLKLSVMHVMVILIMLITQNLAHGATVSVITNV